jgi:ABC-type dipeptide/oligopeptide/nickel transport system ATPase component
MMDGGALVDDAPPEEFFSVPRHARTRAFLARMRSAAGGRTDTPATARNQP